jgi:hypothetical protein
MLQQVLHEVQQAEGSVSIAALSRRLNIEPGVLEGMIVYWIRKGRLKESSPFAGCDAGGCGTSCGSGSSPEGCPFIGKMPRMISLATDDELRTRN